MENSNNVCLIFIYNYKYNENIEILEKIYSERFWNIYHIVPFYEGQKKNVIPVYESSYTFQGYIAQAFRSFYNEKYSHYLFVADDLILNPRIDEINVIESLGLEWDNNYIKAISNLYDNTCWFNYADIVEIFSKYNKLNAYLNYENELPKADEAIKLMNKHNVHFKGINWNNNTLRYPLLMGYSDFIVVSSKSIKRFCHICGVFAAMGLFVEAAIPTALGLCEEKIVTEKDVDFKGIEFWDKAEKKNIEIKYNLNIDTLLSSYDDTLLYIHPIKLSQWKGSRLREVALSRKIYIWGAGVTGESTYDVLIQSGLKVDGFIDSSEQKVGTYVRKLLVFSPQQILEKNKDERPYVVISTVYYNEIVPVLKKNGYTKEKDFIKLFL